MGFGADIKSKDEKKVGETLEKVQFEDLLKFGFIPEFIGRLPVIAVLDQLGESELVKILVEPKNSLIRQYQKFFEMEGVSLNFTQGALDAISHKAIQMKTGARGLRRIIEEVMLDITFDLPSRATALSEVRINEDVILGTSKPEYIPLKKSALA
jgi:ATP-dependent Clp protease ATP-binding subunit ClpX